MVGHIRLGYARASTARQSLDAQLDSLIEAGITRVFISTRATRRPELEAAATLAGEIRYSGVAVTLVVHEHKRRSPDTAAGGDRDPAAAATYGGQKPVRREAHGRPRQFLTDHCVSPELLVVLWLHAT